MASDETFVWSTVVLAISFVLLLVLFLYKMFISPRQVIVSLEKASSGILVSDPPEGSAHPTNAVESPLISTTNANEHNWGRHLTLSLAVLSSILGIMLGWEFENNVYAQEWVSQNLTEVGFITFAVVMGIILLPLAITVLMSFLGPGENGSDNNKSRKTG